MKYVRGSTVSIKATPFLDVDGADVTPSTVSLYLDFPIARRLRDQETVTMSQNADDEWVGEWESAQAFPGTVFYSIRTTGGQIFAEDGSFELVADLANADP